MVNGHSLHPGGEPRSGKKDTYGSTDGDKDARRVSSSGRSPDGCSRTAALGPSCWSDVLIQRLECHPSQADRSDSIWLETRLNADVSLPTSSPTGRDREAAWSDLGRSGIHQMQRHGAMCSTRSRVEADDINFEGRRSGSLQLQRHEPPKVAPRPDMSLVPTEADGMRLVSKGMKQGRKIQEHNRLVSRGRGVAAVALLSFPRCAQLHNPAPQPRLVRP
jgi:hypothetical protein